MSLKMPDPDQGVLARRGQIAAALRNLVPDGVIDDPVALRVYESDGLTAYRQPPMLAVLPRTTAQVSAILAWCHAQGVKVVPRGSGTSLSGGALPLADAVLLGMARFNRVLEIDYADRIAVVQPGVTNLAVTKAVEGEGFYYAPDPSSQIACSIGGNVAENSGGVHCLKYGLTTNNVLGVEMVLMDGPVGQASAIKMCYAGLTKGLHAVGVSVIRGAIQAGVDETFIAELAASQPQLLAYFTGRTPGVFPKAYRWVAEMQEIGDFLGAEGEAIYDGAAALYERMARDHEGSKTEEAELLAFLNRALPAN